MRGGCSGFTHRIIVSRPLQWRSDVRSPRDNPPPWCRAATNVATGPGGYYSRPRRIVGSRSSSPEQSLIPHVGLGPGLGDHDRKQSELYARAGIPLYWVVKRVDGQVEVYSQPGPARPATSRWKSWRRAIS
jgi:hypothetical protein